MRPFAVVVAFLVCAAAQAEESRTVAVLPFSAEQTTLAKPAMTALEESVRTKAGDVLTPLGYVVLTQETTLRYVALLKAAVGVNPRDLGYPFSCWTLDRLREHLARRTRILLSLARLSQVMAQHHMVYRRPKHGMNHLRDPQEYNEKKAFLEFVKKGRRHRIRPSTCSTSMSVRFTSTRP